MSSILNDEWRRRWPPAAYWARVTVTVSLTLAILASARHVRDVLIAGKVVFWKGKLVGWNVDALLRQIEQARDRVLGRINGNAPV